MLFKDPEEEVALDCTSRVRAQKKSSRQTRAHADVAINVETNTLIGGGRRLVATDRRLSEMKSLCPGMLVLFCF